VRAHNWSLAGPHSAQEPWGFSPDEWGEPPSRQPWNASDMNAVKGIFDGYDVGIRYADDAVGTVMNKLADLGILDDTAVLISSDHGEAFGELGVYADHQGADEATCHIPSILKWPGVEPRVYSGLQYHLDIGATVVDLAGIDVPTHYWSGESTRAALDAGTDEGRDALFLSQGAWSCQRGVRFGDHLYLQTWHDGYHPHWNEEMLFDIAEDPHETTDLAAGEPALVAEAAGLLADWTEEQVARGIGGTTDDPMDIVLDEGGPLHVRGHLPAWSQRLGRGPRRPLPRRRDAQGLARDRYRFGRRVDGVTVAQYLGPVLVERLEPDRVGHRVVVDHRRPLVGRLVVGRLVTEVGVEDQQVAGLHEHDHLIVDRRVDDLDIAEPGALPRVGDDVVDVLPMRAGHDPQRSVADRAHRDA